MKNGIWCRGNLISLEEDSDGCWLQTPYYVGVHADSFHPDPDGVWPCHTMNDVESAAALGLLFPDEISARAFVLRLQRENEELNEGKIWN